MKEKYNARIFVDDAHGIGTMGENGRGTADYYGVQDKVDLYFGTFAKSFASIGGFTAADKDVVDWIRYNARTQVFAKSLPMVYVKTLRRALEMVRDGEERRKRMWEISKKMRDGLRELGYYIGLGESPICAVFAPIGEEAAEEVGARLVHYLRHEKNVFTTAVIYPVVPLGLLMFRIIPTAAHSDEDVELTIKAFREMRYEMKLNLSMTDEDRKKIDKVYGK